MKLEKKKALACLTYPSIEPPINLVAFNGPYPLAFSFGLMGSLGKDTKLVGNTMIPLLQDRLSDINAFPLAGLSQRLGSRTT